LEKCKCKSKTTKECEEEGRGRTCRRRRLRRCRRRCLRRACKKRSKKECASKTGKEKKKCIKKHTKVCKRIHIRKGPAIKTKETKVITIIKPLTTEVPKHVPKKALEKVSTEISNKKCGEEEDDKDCRDKVKEEVKKKEEKFREEKLKKCHCKSNAEKECKELKKEGNCKKRRLRRCRRKCLRKGCRERVRKECEGKETKEERSKCRKSKRKICREVQMKPIKILVKVTKKEEKSKVEVPKVLPTTPVKEEAKKEAIKKCGKDEDEKDCREKTEKEVTNKETAFRKVALSQCNCKDSKDKDKCRLDCLREACKIRSKNECKDEGKKCVPQHTEECRSAQSVGIPVRSMLNKVKKILKPDIVKKNCRKRGEDQCGKGFKHLKCRVEYREKCIKKEEEFRRTTLKACGCKSKHTDIDNRYKCRKECLSKACKERASKKCGSGSDITAQNCRLSSNTRCKVFHLNIIPKKIQRRIRRSCRRRARETCGKGSDDKTKSCDDKNRIQCINLENEFRVSALEKCKSRMKAEDACKDKEGDDKKKCIVKKLKAYRKKCLKVACKSTSDPKRCKKIHISKK